MFYLKSIFIPVLLCTWLTYPMAGWQQSLLQVANDKGVRFNKQSPYFKYIGSSRNDVYNWKRNDVFNCKALLQLIIACVLNNLTAFPENMCICTEGWFSGGGKGALKLTWNDKFGSLVEAIFQLNLFWTDNAIADPMPV